MLGSKATSSAGEMKTRRATSPGPEPLPGSDHEAKPHRGVVVTGSNGEDGPKAFYIHTEALPGRRGAGRCARWRDFPSRYDRPGGWLVVQPQCPLSSR